MKETSYLETENNPSLDVFKLMMERMQFSGAFEVVSVDSGKEEKYIKVRFSNDLGVSYDLMFPEKESSVFGPYATEETVDYGPTNSEDDACHGGTF